MYLEVLDVLRNKLVPGALILADNVDHPGAAGYTRLVRAPRSGFDSVTLFGGRLEMTRVACEQLPRRIAVEEASEIDARVAKRD